MSNQKIYNSSLLVLILLLAGCVAAPHYEAKFKKGDVVISKVDGTKGVILDVVWGGGEYNYRVRFKTKLLLPNRYSIHLLNESELELK